MRKIFISSSSHSSAGVVDRVLVFSHFRGLPSLSDDLVCRSVHAHDHFSRGAREEGTTWFVLMDDASQCGYRAQVRVINV